MTTALATLGGEQPRLCRAIDARLLAAALAAGAREWQFPHLLRHEVLERAGYFEAFPDHATSIAAGGLPDDADWVLQPAVCYHVYSLLATQPIERDMITAAGRCYRRREPSFDGLTRLWEFTMREIVLVGDAAWVRAERDAWLEAAPRLAAELGVEARLMPATDSFMGDAGRGRALMQRLKGLKHELRAEAGEAGNVAIASVNLHESFFGDRFHLTLADGSVAHSACVAFGLERFAAAHVAQRGPATAVGSSLEV